MSERIGMSVNQVTDEVLYTGLFVMQEPLGGQTGPRPSIHKVVNRIYA
ncbi:MAG: hypothetical protein P8J49_03385 [SAR324 cluster bacterium]|nr:hypothetical protein [SAR324 cluster bacterium]